MIFILLLPLGLVPQFAKIDKEVVLTHLITGDLFIWLTIPFCNIVAWVFNTMKKIG